MKKAFLGFEIDTKPHKIVRELVAYMLKENRLFSIDQLVNKLSETNTKSNLRTRVKRCLTNTPDIVNDRTSEQSRIFSIPLQYKNVEVVQENEKFSLKLLSGNIPEIRETNYTNQDLQKYLERKNITLNMATNKNEELHKLKQDFLDYWTLEKLQNMTLEQYTDTKRENSFCYWLEHITRDLGSIVGGSSYKFGIYKMGTSSKTESATNRDNDGVYAWHTKYGITALEAFSTIKKLILQIANASQENKITTIDEIDLGNAYKWKIAFLYGNYNCLNMFKLDALRIIASNLNIEYTNKTPISTFHIDILKLKPKESEYFNWCHKLWKQYQNRLIDVKKDFAKWLNTNTYESYRNYLGDSTKSIETKLDEINNYFDDIDFFLVDPKKVNELISTIFFLLSKKERIKNPDFVEYDSKNSNGIPKAILGKNNYIKFLTEKFDYKAPNLENEKLYIKINDLIQKYKNALLNENWLYVELYKFEWANWLTERVVFEEQTDEEILELCLASQSENYTDSKGVQFIKQGAREKLSKYIGIEDVQIFRAFYNGVELENIDYSSRNMSFPILSCWMSVFAPDTIFPASRTSFTDIIKEVFSIKIKQSKIDFVIAMQKPMQEICSLLLENEEIINFVSQKLHKSELSQLDVNWLTQDFLLFVDRHPNLINPISETVEEEVEQYIMLEKMPTNQILYGPPGTGKTYYLKDQLFDKYTTKQTSITKEQHFETVVSSCSWWQVIAIALLDLGKSKVSDIFNHKWVQKKASLSNSKNVRPTLWGQLQSHTINECEFVNVSSRQQPLLFNKTKDSFWEILEDEVQELVPELYDLKDSVDNYNPNPDTIIKNYEFVTFHQSFAYEDFIEGIKPISPEEGEENKDLGYAIEDGVFKKLCLKAKNDPNNRYAIFIDEINRGNVSAIFGELITLIEIDKRKDAKNEISIKLPYSKTVFSVPSNIDIYGTMNTADRSVEALDTALRRRFEFKEMMPDYDVIQKEEVEEIKLSDVLEKINQRIELLIDRDHTIGHSYFVNVDTLEKLANAFNNKIVPLLQEYFYGDYGKIGLVLGNGFVKINKNDTIHFANFKYENSNDFRIASYELKHVDENTVMDAVLELLGKKEISE